MSASTRTWRGLTFGGPGTPYRIEKETGLDDLDVRSGIRPLPRLAGAAPGEHYATARSIVLDLGWGADTAAAAEAVTSALRAVTGPSETTLYEYGITRADNTVWFVRGRVARRQIPRDVDSETLGSLRGSLVIECPDPRIYSAESRGVLIPNYGNAGGGIDLPAQIPWNMDPPELITATAVNNGNTDAWPLIRFEYPAASAGTATAFLLTNMTTGQEFEVITALTAGQTLTADMDAFIRATGGQIIGIGGASRYGDWSAPRDPFALAPGTNLLRFDLTGDAPVVARVDWRDTDL